MLETVGLPIRSSSPETVLLRILLIGAILCLSLAVSFVNPAAGIGLFAVTVLGLFIRYKLQATMMALTLLLAVDPQIALSSTLFLPFDLLFGILGIPILWILTDGKQRIGFLALFLLPYFVYAVGTSATRAQSGFWFWASVLRLFMFLLVIIAVSYMDRIERLVALLGSTLIPLTFYGLYQLTIDDFGGLFFLVNGHYQDQPWMGRAYSFFFHPNAFGAFCATVSVMMAALVIRSKNSKFRTWGFVCVAAGLLGLLVSGSRGAEVGCLASLLVLFALTRSKLWKLAGVAILLIVPVAYVASVSTDTVSRAQDADDFTIETRGLIYLTAAQVFLQHPWFGVGFTNFEAVFASLVPLERWNTTAVHAHNIYLQTLAEGGIVGFVLYFGPVFYMLWRNIRAARGATIPLVAAVGMISFLGHGFLDDISYFSPQYLFLIAVIFGLAVRPIPARDTNLEWDASNNSPAFSPSTA